MRIIAASFLALSCISLASCIGGETAQDSGHPTLAGFITQIGGDEGGWLLVVDPIEWFSGEEAARAMAEDDPACAERESGCTPPNGYYIRNPEGGAVTYRVSDDVVIAMQTFDPNELVPDQPVSFEQFLVALIEGDRVSARYEIVPFWITLEEDRIVGIREQYIP